MAEVSRAHGASISFGGSAGATTASVLPTDVIISVNSACINALPQQPIMTSVILVITGGGATERVRLKSYHLEAMKIYVSRESTANSFPIGATISYWPSSQISNAVSIGMPGSRCTVSRMAIVSSEVKAFLSDGTEESVQSAFESMTPYTFSRVYGSEAADFPAITVTAPMSLDFDAIRHEVPMRIELPYAGKAVSFFGFIAAIQPTAARVDGMMYENLTVQVSSPITVTELES